MSKQVKIATYNAPHRLLHKNLKRDFQKLADMGCDVIVAQEQTDNDPPKVCPRGWRFYRPKKARHNVVYWNPKRVKDKKRGAQKVNQHAGATWVRYIVWVHFATPIGPMRVGGIHLPAFKTSRPANAKEFRYQEKKLTAWLKGGKWRVLGGDYNARIPSSWVPNLQRVGRFSKQVVSGPHKAKIDYVGVAKHGPYKITSTTTMSGGSDHKAVIVTLRKSTAIARQS